MNARQVRSTMLALCLVVPLLVSCSTGSVAADDRAALETLFRDAWPADQPGGAVLIKKGDEVVLRAGHGLADVEMGVAITPDMVFRVGSVTKQFTAALIMQLVEEGKVAIDAPITDYLPDYDTHDATVTVEHLLTHTSGIPSYTGLPDFFDQVRADRTPEEMVDLWEELELEFAPGTDWRYNNSGYFLLGMIIEAVTGQSYQEALQERIFTPLGMTSSYYGEHDRIIPKRVEGYAGGSDGYVNAPYLSMTQPYAAGSMLSTVDDLAVWQQALEAGKVVSAESLEVMWRAHRLPDGDNTDYGYGFQIGEHAGHQIVRHGGGINGFAAQLTTVPDQDIVVAVLTNHTGAEVSPTRLAALATARLLGESIPTEEVEIAADKLDDYVGVYRIDEETTRAVNQRDGKLLTLRTGNETWSTAVAGGEDLFFYPTGTNYFTFERDAEGKVVAMLMHDFAATPERAVLTDEPVPEAAETVDVAVEAMERLVGDYQLMPEFVLSIFIEDGALLSRGTGQDAIPLLAESELEWIAPQVGARLIFTPDADGAVTSVTLRQGGQEIVGPRVDQ
ncbi:MAG: serine hydrolase [Acidobacteriota bacterium]